MDTPETPSAGPWGDPQSWQPPVGEPPEQPRSIRKAVRLMWVGAVLQTLGIVALYVQTDELRDAMRDADDRDRAGRAQPTATTTASAQPRPGTDHHPRR